VPIRTRPASRAARIAATALLAGAALGGCAKKAVTTRPQVGVTLLTEAHVFYQDLKRGMQQAADSLGVDLHIVAGEWDLARQTSQVENFITQGMDAIVIAPVDSRGIVSAVEEANRAKIPVFTADIAAVGPFGRGYRRVKFIFDMSDGSPKILYRQDLSRLGWALGEKARQTLVATDTQ